MARAGFIPASSVGRALVAVGDRWSLLILGAAFQGCVRFGDWKLRIGIASNVLSSRLQRLVRLGCLKKIPDKDARGSQYRLTPMGAELYPTALMFWRFDRLWSEKRLLHPETLTHLKCGRPMLPRMLCPSCGKPVYARDVRYEDGPGAGLETMPPPRVSRRSSVTLEDNAGAQTLFGASIDFLGDRWTQLVLAAFFLGVRRFDEIQARCGIATNILSHRLKLLVEGELLQRRRYQTGPDRYEYVLTPKGMDVYPIALTLLHWGDRWLATSAGPPLILWHVACGARLEPIVVCDQCGQQPDPHDVTFAREEAGGEAARVRGTVLKPAL